MHAWDAKLASWATVAESLLPYVRNGTLNPPYLADRGYGYIWALNHLDGGCG
jgi:hypothetical protein